MGAYATQRAKERIAELAGRGDDLVTFWRECTDAIAAAVPFYLTPCFYTLDPASLLVTSHYHDGLPEIPQEWLALEYYEHDVNKLADVARAAAGVATLHEATGGDPSRSARYRTSIHPLGGEQEALIALRTPSGAAWGILALYREPGQRRFDRDELRFLRDVSGHLAEGACRALLIGEATDPEGPEAPGLIVLGDDWELESMTPGVEYLLAELPDGDWNTHAKLPPAALAVAGRALRAAAAGESSGEIAFARVLSRSGRWIVLHGASLVSEDRRRVAVIVEPAHPARIAPLLMSAYALTEREQQITRLVLQGHSTAQIAECLIVSPHTVQQHLKHIFEKTGVRSRRDLDRQGVLLTLRAPCARQRAPCDRGKARSWRTPAGHSRSSPQPAARPRRRSAVPVGIPQRPSHRLARVQTRASPAAPARPSHRTVAVARRPANPVRRSVMGRPYSERVGCVSLVGHEARSSLIWRGRLSPPNAGRLQSYLRDIHDEQRASGDELQRRALPPQCGRPSGGDPVSVGCREGQQPTTSTAPTRPDYLHLLSRRRRAHHCPVPR